MDPGTTGFLLEGSGPTDYTYFLAAWNIAADIALALLPATCISKLNLNQRKKIALCVLLGLGLIAALFSGIKTHYLGKLNGRADFTWSAFEIHARTGAEAFIMMLCGNIPPLIPLWDRLQVFSKKNLARSGTSGGAELGTGSSWNLHSSQTETQISGYGLEEFSDARTRDISVRADVDVRSERHTGI
ncbi:hypothetical protein GGR57DRAFT_505986 [Xylariaceae sp. FL1272]|nr:hypothetical protein GGR57DRAFT_505986 [Xylariaceae sp. FL1272]